MRILIYNILVEYYGRKSFDNSLCDTMANFIVDRVEEGLFTTQWDVQKYIWINYGGGDTAELVAAEIRQAWPDRIKEG